MLNYSRLKEFADDILNFDEKGRKFSELVENTGKKENCSLPAISPFSTVIFNPLPHMAILGFSNSAANKDMMSKIWTNGDTDI